jgi:hypothetical protein
MLVGKRRGEGRAEAVRRVKAWVAAHAVMGENDAVMVTELQCSEEGCPPIETVLALLRPGHEPLKWKVHKPVVEVAESDVSDAIARGDHHD